MSRELKFRAWDKLRKAMNMFTNPKDGLKYCCGEFSASSGWDSYDRPTYEEDTQERFTIMQFTGIKDRNGKDIYEGDILNCEPWAGHGSYAVTWDAFSASFSSRTQPWAWPQHAKIIGNIYENPELLTP